MNIQYDELALAVSQNAARRAARGGTIVREVVIIADSQLVMSDSRSVGGRLRYL